MLILQKFWCDFFSHHLHHIFCSFWYFDSFCKHLQSYASFMWFWCNQFWDFEWFCFSTVGTINRGTFHKLWDNKNNIILARKVMWDVKVLQIRGWSCSTTQRLQCASSTAARWLDICTYRTRIAAGFKKKTWWGSTNTPTPLSLVNSQIDWVFLGQLQPLPSPFGKMQKRRSSSNYCQSSFHITPLDGFRWLWLPWAWYCQI